MRLLRSRPIRVALGWQGVAALALTAIAWATVGPHAGWSALLGVLVGIVANLGHMLRRRREVVALRRELNARNRAGEPARQHRR